MGVPERRPSDSPFVGPRPFAEEHAGLFFGRDREAAQLCSLVVSRPAVVLYSQSGAGKTSLLNARVVPELRRRGFEVLPPARVRGEHPAGAGNWFIANVVAGWEGRNGDPPRSSGERLAEYLSRRPCLEGEFGEPKPRLAIFDQFEELFTRHQDRWRDREGFFEQVAEALDAEPTLRVLFTLREEYVALLDPFAPLLPERLGARFRLERLDEEAATEAIAGPLARVGHAIDEGLARELVLSLLTMRVETSAGEVREVLGEFVEPVQLQVVCLGLPLDRGRLGVEHFSAFGDVDRVLAGFYEESVAAVAEATGEPVGDLRLWFEQKLITPLGTRGTVLREKATSGGLANAAADALEARHLIRGERRAGSVWYELTHDRFIKPILDANERWLPGRERVGRTGEFLRVKLRAFLDARVRRREEDALVARAWGGEEAALLEELEVVEAERWREEADSAGISYDPAIVELLGASRAAVEAKKARLEAERRAEIERGVLENARLRRHTRIVLGLLGVTVSVLVIVLALAFYSHTLKARVDAANRGLTEEQKKKDEAIARLNEANARVVAEGRRREGLLTSLEAQKTKTDLALVESERIRRDLERAKGEALARATEADIRRLLAESASLTSSRVDLSLLLSLEVLNRVEALGGAQADLRRRLGPEARGSLLAGLQSAPYLDRYDFGHASPITGLASNPGGNLVVSCGRAGELFLWETVGRNRVWRVDTARGRAGAAEFSAVAFRPPQGDTLATADEGGGVVLWDVANQSPPLRLAGAPGPVHSLAFSPDGRVLAAGCDRGLVATWDLPDRKPSADDSAIRPTVVPSGGESVIWGLAISPDGETLAASDDVGRISWGKLSANKPFTTLISGSGTRSRCLAFSPDGTKLAWASSNKQVGVVDRRTRQVDYLEGHDGGVRTLAFSTDGRLLASGGLDSTVFVWDLRRRRPPRQLRGHRGIVAGLAFLPGPPPDTDRGDAGEPKDAALISAGGGDLALIRWTIRDDPHPLGTRFAQGRSAILKLVARPDGQALAAGYADGFVRLWKFDGRGDRGEAPLWEARGHGSFVRSLAYDPGGRFVASGGEDGRVIVRDAADGRELGRVDHGSEVRAVAFGDGGRTLATAGNQGGIRLWRVSSRGTIDRSEQPRALDAHGAPIWCVEFAPDGKTLASGDSSGKLILWEDGKAVPTRGHGTAVLCLAFAPDGGSLASAGSSDGILLWDVPSGRPRGSPLSGHRDSIHGLAYVDGTTLVSAGGDDRVMLWDLATRRPVGLPFEGHRNRVWSVVVPPKAPRPIAVSGGDDGAIMAWDLGLEAWRSRAEAVVHRNLSPEEWGTYFGDEPYRATIPGRPVGRVAGALRLSPPEAPPEYRSQ